MANTRLDYDRIYGLVMECRTSGLTDRQWCINHDIPSSTFYNWIRTLRQRACYEIPGHDEKRRNTVSAPTQDVVCVNVTQPAAASKMPGTEHMAYREPAQPIILQYQDFGIRIPENFSMEALAKVLRVVCGGIC